MRILGPENVVCLLCLQHIFECTRLDLIQESNLLNPYQTAPLRFGSIQCLQYKLAKYINTRNNTQD